MLKTGPPTIRPKIFLEDPYLHLQHCDWPTNMTAFYTGIVDVSKTKLYYQFGELTDMDRQTMFLSYIAKELIMVSKHNIFKMKGEEFTRVPELQLLKNLRDRLLNLWKTRNKDDEEAFPDVQTYAFNFSEFDPGEFYF